MSDPMIDAHQNYLAKEEEREEAQLWEEALEETRFGQTALGLARELWGLAERGKSLNGVTLDKEGEFKLRRLLYLITGDGDPEIYGV